MRLTHANSKAVDYACRHFHYSQSVPAVQYAYNVYNDQDEWCGCILYGGGANNNLAKSFGKNAGEVLELERVALNGKQEQTSKAVAMSLKQHFYKGKWTHERSINSRANRDELKRILPKRENSNKFKYVFCFDKKERKKYLALAQPYPKDKDLTFCEGQVVEKRLSANN